MIRLDALAGLVTSPGPYATAYLDDTRAEELGPHKVELRWRTVRESLAEQGADEATLAAMAAAVGHPDVPGPHGQVLVGAGGRVVGDFALPRPPRRQEARWSPLPHLMPMVTALGPVVPHVLALVDRIGADVTVHGPGGKEEDSTVTGHDYPIHRTGLGGWAHLRYVHRTEDLWEANARLVADVIESGVRRTGARVVILSGDVRAREALRKVLDEPARDLVVELQTGGRAEGIDEERLREEVDAVIARVAADQDRAVIDRFSEARGRAAAGVGDVLAVAGVDDTIEALRKAQVEHLLILDDPSRTETALVGPEPVQLGRTAEELAAIGVDDPLRDRLDAALLRAVAGTDAAVVTLADGQLDLRDGVGATLRYPDPPSRPARPGGA